MDPIQGLNAVLSFYGDSGWEPFVCTSNSTLTIDGDMLPTRTVGDGQWKKFEYSTMGFEIELGGVFVFADSNFRGLDTINAQLAQLSLPFRLTFLDDVGNIWTYQGTILVKTSAINSTVGEVVKNTHTLQGSGALIVFAGYVPCATTINGITFSGLGSAGGNVVVSYTFTGDLYQVLYSVDGGGNATAAGAENINLNGMEVGAHSITITPICSNGFQGIPLTQTFTVTQAQTCTSTITSVTVDTTALTATPSWGVAGTATQFQWWIGNGNPVIVPKGTIISLKNLAPGTYTINMQPVCVIGSNQLFGTGAQATFTISQQPSYGNISWTALRNMPAIGYIIQFQIFVDGVLVVSQSPSGSGSFTVQVGQTVRASVVAMKVQNGQNITSTVTLLILDTTLNTTLTNQTNTAINAAANFQFTMTGDNYTINMETDI